MIHTDSTVLSALLFFFAGGSEDAALSEAAAAEEVDFSAGVPIMENNNTSLNLFFPDFYLVNSPLRAPPSLMTKHFRGFWMILVISQPKTVRFSSCNKPLKDENAPYLMRAPPNSLRACLGTWRPYLGIYGMRS